jgi:hypothetical protein
MGNYNKKHITCINYTLDVSERNGRGFSRGAHIFLDSPQQQVNNRRRHFINGKKWQGGIFFFLSRDCRVVSY